MARVALYKHATYVNPSTYPDDGTSPVGTTEWNLDPAPAGMLGFTPTNATIAIASNALLVTDSITVATGESGAADDIDTITLTNTNDYDLIYLFGQSGYDITLKHGDLNANGEISTVSGEDEVLSAVKPTILIRKGNYWYGYGGGTVSDGAITNAKLANMAANTVKVRNASSAGVPSDVALTTTQILIGDGTGFTAAALSGEATMTNAGAVTIATLNQNTTGSSATCTGLAATATALATGRTIGGTSFDGTANIAVALSATTTALANARTIGGTSFDGTANIAVALSATATALATARTIAASGDIVWSSGTFDGSTNVTAVAAIGSGVIVDDDISGSAAIANGKLATNPLLYPNMTAPSAAVAFNAQKLTGVADGVADTDAATKGQIDVAARGLDAKDSCRVATTANITLSGEQSIDSVTTTTDRVLVKNQSTATQNGIYVSASGSWARSTDTDANAEVTSGMFTFITEGTTQASQGFVLTTDDPITVGSTALVFSQFSGVGQITAGDALTKTGNTLNVDVGIANNEVAQFNATPADDDFLRIDGTKVEGLNAGEVLTAIAAQPLDAQLTDVAGLAVTNGNFIVGDGSNFVAESAGTARTSLGLGTIATQASNSVDIDGGAIDGAVIGANSAAAITGAAIIGTSLGLGSGAITSGAITSSAGFTGTQVDILANGDLRLQDAAGNQYVGFEAPTTVTTYTVKLPAAIGAVDEVLKIASLAGTVATVDWGSAGGGSTQTHDFIVQTSTSYTPSDPVDTTRRIYIKNIDSNNEGVFALIAKNGSTEYEEVQLA